MTRYIGDKVTEGATSTITLNSTNIQTATKFVGVAYNYGKLKLANSDRYIHNVYVSKPTYTSSYVVGQGPVQTITGYHWEPIKKGYMFGPYGPLQFWDRPMGIPGILNVALMKAQPHTMVVALYNNGSKASLVKVNPTGLEDLRRPMSIHIAGFGEYYNGKIVIAGIDNSGKYAIWDCNNTDWRFDKIWTNDVAYSTTSDTTNAFVSSHWRYGDSSYAPKIQYSAVTVVFPNADAGHTEVKVVTYMYDEKYDSYLFDILYSDKVCYTYSLFNDAFLSGGGALQNWYMEMHYQMYAPNASSVGRGQVPLSGAQFYVNRFLEGYTGNNYFISCTYTPSGGSTTGYTFYGAGNSWTQMFYGDNCYRICQDNPMGYYWGVGYTNNNYWRSLFVPSASSWWSSKVTFPATQANTLRVHIPGDAIMLLNSSTIYTLDYNKMASGTDQTVGTATLLDPNGNPFTVKQACWNHHKRESNLMYKQAHTFFVASNDTNGLLMSLTGDWQYGQRELIEVGGPVIVPRRNMSDLVI